MESTYLTELHESCRSLLLNTESLRRTIEKEKDRRLKNALSEMLRTAQADLFLFNDFVYELMNCETDNDIQFVLKSVEANKEAD